MEKKFIVKGNSALKSRNMPSWVPMPKDKTSEGTSDRERSHSKGFFNVRETVLPDGQVQKKKTDNTFQNASYINFKEYGMATSADIKHCFNQVDSKELDRKQASGSELTENRKNSSVVSFDQDQNQFKDQDELSPKNKFQRNSTFANFMQQRSTAFTDFVAQQASATKNNGPKSMLTDTMSIDNNFTPKTPAQPPKYVAQDKIKRAVADRIKESVAKYNEKYSADSRSGDLAKLDKKLLREIDLANKIKSLQGDYNERIVKIKQEQEEFKSSANKSIIMKQRLSDLLEKSNQIKKTKHSELQQLKHNRVDYLNILSDQSQQATEGNEEPMSVETERTPLPLYIKNLKEADLKNNTPNGVSTGQDQQFNFTYRDKVAALTGGFDNFSQTIPIGSSLLQQQSSKLTNSVFSAKRKTLNALITSNKEQGASTIDVSQISGPEADPSILSSRVTFDDTQWKLQTSRILDNNKYGKGSVFPMPLLGQYSKVEDPNEFFKRKNQMITEEPIQQKATTSGQIDLEPQKGLLVKVDGFGKNLNMNSGNVNFASMNSFQKPMSHLNMEYASYSHRISQISEGPSTIQQSGTKVTEQRSSPLSTEEDILKGPAGGIYSIPFLPMAKLSGYHKADKIREDNTGVLTGALTGQNSNERGNMTNSVLPEITVGMDRPLRSVKPFTREKTRNTELNRGEYDVSDQSQNTEEAVVQSATEANPNTLQGSQAKSSQISSQQNLPDAVHELPRPAVNTSAKHSKMVSMSPNSFEEYNRSGQHQIQIDDYNGREEFYRMANFGSLDAKSNNSRLSPVPTDGPQMNQYREQRQNGQDEPILKTIESEYEKEQKHQIQIEQYTNLSSQLINAHEHVAKNLSLGLDQIHLSEIEKTQYQNARFSQKTSPRALRGNQINDQGRLQPLRGGGGSIPHGSEHLQTFGYSYGKYSPVRLQKANIYHAKLPLGIIQLDGVKQIDSLSNSKIHSSNDDSRPRLMNQTMNLPSLQNQKIESTYKMKAIEVKQKQKMVSRLGPAGELYMTMFEKSEKTAQTPFLSNSQKGKWSTAMHSLHKKQIVSNHQESTISPMQQVLNQNVKWQTLNKRPLKYSHFRDLSAVTVRGKNNDDFLARESSITIKNTGSKNLKFKSKVTYNYKKAQKEPKLDIQLPSGMTAPRGFMGGKEEQTSQPDEKTLEVSESKKDIKELTPIIKKKIQVSKVLQEKPCPPFSKDNIFRKRSASEAPQNYPGSEQLRALHNANLNEMPLNEFRKIVGQLSWKINPENELRLWDLCKEVQLFELLQYGMTREERNAQIEKSRPKRKRQMERTDTTHLGEGEDSKTPSAVNTGQLNTQMSQTTIREKDGASTSSPTPVGSKSHTALAESSPEPGQQYSDHVLHQMKTMTVQQLYELNVLSSIDLNLLAPSLHTKLMEQKNQILYTQKEREKYKQEVKDTIAKMKIEQLQSSRSKEAMTAVDHLLNMTEEDWELIRQRGNKLKTVCKNGHGMLFMNDKPATIVDLSLDKNKLKFQAKKHCSGPREVTCTRCTRVIQGREQFIHCGACRISYCKLCMYEVDNKKQMEAWANFDTILAQMGAKRTLRQLRQEYGHTLPVNEDGIELISEQ